jgi:hypothetical protein
MDHGQDAGEGSAGDIEGTGHFGGRGLSRRQMIRAAAVTGAAAWSAPVIIDSLTSPAAAGSVCVKYYAKLDTSGACVAHDPACGYSVASATKYVCCSVDTTGEDCPYPAKLPSLSTLAANTNYYQVVLTSGCFFGPLPGSNTSSNWQVVGNYNFNCVRLTGSAGATAPTASYTGDGYFQVGGNTAWIRKSHNFGGTIGTVAITYVYLQFCCGS